MAFGRPGLAAAARAAGRAARRWQLDWYHAMIDSSHVQAARRGRSGPSPVDRARPAHDGVVIEAFGSGNVPPGAVAAMGRWLEERKPVVLASRCWWGQVAPLYAFDGGGARTTAMGAIPAGPRTPSQARMELTIALSAGVPYGAP